MMDRNKHPGYPQNQFENKTSFEEYSPKVAWQSFRCTVFVPCLLIKANDIARAFKSHDLVLYGYSLKAGVFHRNKV